MQTIRTSLLLFTTLLLAQGSWVNMTGHGSSLKKLSQSAKLEKTLKA
jgi:hypothetical protein